MNLHLKEENTNTGKNKKMENILKIEGYELLNQKVYRLLKESIIKGFLEPGTKLLENKIAEEMQVSRTPVREAMQKLVAEGFVKTTPNQTMVVTEVSPEDVKEVLQIRGVLEGLAARIAAKKINRQEIDELENVVTQMSLHVSKENLSSYCQVDDEFHNLILNICGNKWIIQIRDNLGSFIYRFRIKSLSVPGRLKCSLEEHQAIMKSLKKHDSVEADRLKQIHMENTVINILKNVVKEKDRDKNE
ncbi:HTH-type transcriptional repressor RspR [subsurface metagenome]